MKLLLLIASLALTSAKPASEEVSLVAEPVPDLTTGSAPAYWSAECGGRTYVGSYTLMMDWAQCRDYCSYFPHAAELGHTFSFADITDVDTMECLRYNMIQQYSPVNGFDGHYWAGGYRGGDGQYRWDSGATFEFDDFVGNPGEDPYVHLTPGNNYQWNTKNDQDDKNNGCLCKSQDTSSEVKIVAVCPTGWYSVGETCARFAANDMDWYDARDYCHYLDAELFAWRTEAEWKMAEIFFNELLLFGRYYAWVGAYKQKELWGDWVWGNNTEGDYVPIDYGWKEGEPTSNQVDGDCGRMYYSFDCYALHRNSCDWEFPPVCQKTVEY